MSLSLQAAREAAQWEDSYSRMAMVLDQRPNMRRADWWRLLGGEWSVCDNIASHYTELADIFRTAGPGDVRKLMTAAEVKAWAALPAIVSVYRGCYADLNERGFSWMLDPNIAAKFPTLLRYRRLTGRAIVLQGTVEKALTALKLNRGESELIVLRPHTVAIAGRRRCLTR